MEKKGYNIGDLKAEKVILTEKYFGKGRSHFSIDTWRITSEERNGEYSECVLTGKVKGNEIGRASCRERE